MQETFLKARREFREFVGSGERELVRLAAADPRPDAWPTRPSTTAARAATTSGRSRSRRCSIARARPCSRPRDPSASPSAHAVRREQAVLLADALEKLPADYREVFILRNLEHIPFDEVAARMGRSPGDRVLWKRDGPPQPLLRDQS